MKSNTFDVYCEGQLEFIQLDAILAPAALTYLRAFQLCYPSCSVVALTQIIIQTDRVHSPP